MPSTYDPIATQDITGNSSVTFSSIPSTYTDLKIVFVSKGNPSFYPNVFMTFNGDTSNNYSQTNLRGNGSTVVSNVGSNQPWINITTHIAIQEEYSFFDISIFSYAGSTNKTVLFSNSQYNSGGKVTTRAVGLWRNTSAITSINFVPGTWFYEGTATLYGILKA